MKAKAIRAKHYIVTQYWLAYFVNNLACGLCGNTGVINTKGRAISAAGIDFGMETFCICPNGQQLRSRR